VIDHRQDVIVADWLGGSCTVNLDWEQHAWRWAREHALEWNAQMEAEKLRCLKTYKHRAKGDLHNPIWQELTSIDGRMTVGHALVCERRRVMIDRLALVDEWQRDVARQQAASPMRGYQQLIDNWKKECSR
jgi:hypothetical protein